MDCVIKIVKLVADEAGASHFTEEAQEAMEVDFAPPAPPLFMTSPRSSRRSLFLLVPKGWYGDFHPAPAQQLMTVLRGELEVSASDGETRRFGVGATVQVEDTAGQGHATRAVQETLVVVVQS